jgi:hypothetical protein
MHHLFMVERLHGMGSSIRPRLLHTDLLFVPYVPQPMLFYPWGAITQCSMVLGWLHPLFP